jgi:hypothetical protein
MNILGRTIGIGEILVLDDGTHVEAAGGNGMKRDAMGRSIFAYPVDPETHKRIGDIIRVEADISPAKTKEYHNESGPTLVG